MKTKIITLESHDDLISLRDKLSWAKTPRILLVAPKYEKVNLRVLDLKVLQRHADALGAQLGLVTRRLKMKRDAESLGIPVFKSTTEAQKKEWSQPAPREQHIPKPPRRDLRELREIAYPKEAAWRTSLLGRIITFTFGVAAMLAIAILFIPRAQVTVYPELKNQSVGIPISASESQQDVSITGAIPARKLSVTVAAEQSLAVTKTVTLPKTKSQGLARFSNLTQGEINIPKGTIISTTEEPRARFVTLNDALFGKDNKFLDVKIESIEAGSRMNVPALTIKTVEGLLGFSLTVTNLMPTSGGSDVTAIGATDDDRARLRQTVMENLRREAEAQMNAQIQPADFLLTDTIEMTEINAETFSPPVGEPGNTLTLKMKLSFSARYVAAEDWRQVAAAALNSSIPAGFAPLGEDFSYETSAPVTDAAGVTHFDLQVSRPMLRTVDKLRVFSLARGNDPALVKDKLTAEIPMRQPPQITLTPSWWKWMPLIPFNVAVEVK